MMHTIRAVMRWGLVVAMLASGPTVWGQAAPPANVSQDLEAARQLARAKELLSMNEEDRGLKMLQNLPRLFPTSKVRFEAQMELGRYYEGKKDYALAIKQVQPVLQCENQAMVCEAYYEIGKCYYHLNQYTNAFTFLRKVTTDFPNSVFANQAYYYVGMCHFDQQHWKKSIDALRMVGTAVSQEEEGSRYMEAGQRFMVKIHDKDLVVLAKDGKPFTIEISTNRGDKEILTMNVLDREGEYYLGSLPTVPGEPKANSGAVEIAGGDVIITDYVDSNTADGKRNIHRTFQTKVVSTATASFTDGAYAAIVKGVFLGQDLFVRVTDLDRDVTVQPDRLTVDLDIRYVVKDKDDDSAAPKQGVSTEDLKIETRDALHFELTETGGHTGAFTGSLRLREIDKGATPNPDDEVLQAAEGDLLRVRYLDELHIDGDEEVERSYEAQVVGGSMTDVLAHIRTLHDLELKAKKNLVEAEAMKELATIFKGVGLKEKCKEKATEGLNRCAEIVLEHRNVAPILVQEALKMKWELYLVLEQLPDAIRTCNELLTLFPESSLADQAMVKIGQANLEKGNYQQAIAIFTGVLGMPRSDQRAFAAFHIGEAYEKMAETTGTQSYLTSAMTAYKSCADHFPTSAYAGEALEKVANFYLKMNDYIRAEELMKNVFQDFPDLENMDKMLLKWAIALYRLNRLEEALQKLNELINEYPESQQAPKARQYRDLIEKKLGKKPSGDEGGGGAAAPAAAAGGGG